MSKILIYIVWACAAFQVYAAIAKYGHYNDTLDNLYISDGILKDVELLYIDANNHIDTLCDERSQDMLHWIFRVKAVK